MKSNIKISIISLFFFCATAGLSFAQTYGFVDSDYVSQNIPEYVAAQTQLEQLSEELGQEVSALYSEVDELYEQYQKESSSLSQSQKEQRQTAIIEKEQEMQELQNRYFGNDGELIKKREELITPINERILKAIKEIAIEENLVAVFDSSLGDNLLYANPNYDISDKVLKKLGITNN